MSEISGKKVFVTREHIIPDAIAHLKQFFDVAVWEERSAPPREVMLQKAQENDAIITEITDLVDKELLDKAPRLKMDRMLQMLRETKPAVGQERVLYPGLAESEDEKDRRANGVPLHKEVMEWFDSMVGELGVPALKTM